MDRLVCVARHRKAHQGRTMTPLAMMTLAREFIAALKDLTVAVRDLTERLGSQ